MPENNLGLKDEEFWTDPYRTRAEIETPIMKKGAEAMLLGAPAQVPMDAHDTLPVVVIRAATLKTMAKLGLRRNALVTAINLDSNVAYAELAMNQDVGKLPPIDPDAPLEGMGGEAYEFDLREILRIPWKTSEYLVAFIVRDQITNRARVKIVNTLGGYKDGEVEKFIDEYKKTARPVFKAYPPPGDPFPNYRQQKNSVGIPKEEGFEIQVERVNVIRKPGSYIMRGSFRLPIKENQIVPPPPEIPGETVPAKPVTALVPINLVLTGSKIAAPFVWRITVPSYEPVERSDSKLVATGYFAVDLSQLGPVNSIAQTMFIYGFSGEAMVGPIPMAFIDQASLED